MTKPKFITEEIRQSEGKAEPVSNAYMINAGKERQGHCQACGKEINNQYGVKLPNGALLWVGSECKKILCKSDAITLDVAPGTQWTDNGKSYVKPTEDWITRLQIGTMGETLQSIIDRKGLMMCGGLPAKNQFLFSIWDTYRQYGQLTEKQYTAASKSI